MFLTIHSCLNELCAWTSLIKKSLACGKCFLIIVFTWKQYHPDMNKGPGAEEKFKEISAAYEVTSCFLSLQNFPLLLIREFMLNWWCNEVCCYRRPSLVKIYIWSFRSLFSIWLQSVYLGIIRWWEKVFIWPFWRGRVARRVWCAWWQSAGGKVLNFVYIFIYASFFLHDDWYLSLHDYLIS